jgi:hypothetical protein
VHLDRGVTGEQRDVLVVHHDRELLQAGQRPDHAQVARHARMTAVRAHDQRRVNVALVGPDADHATGAAAEETPHGDAVPRVRARPSGVLPQQPVQNRSRQGKASGGGPRGARRRVAAGERPAVPAADPGARDAARPGAERGIVHAEFVQKAADRGGEEFAAGLVAGETGVVEEHHLAARARQVRRERGSGGAAAHDDQVVPTIQFGRPTF